MKSQIFTTAWKLVKEFGLTLSEALTTAWAAYKEEAIVKVNITWNKKRVLSFSKGNSYAATIERLRELLAMTTPNISGASTYYGIGVYNGD